MLQQALDFREECDVLAELLEPATATDWQRKTKFKQWTVDDVLAHLHFFNHAADLSLRDGHAFDALFARLFTAMGDGTGHLAFSHDWLEGVRGRALFDLWRGFYPEMADRFDAADPEARLKWAGPDMSVRMSITARQMETWAHGQALFDLFAKPRRESDRIKNIAVIGIKTYGWTFANRGIEPPGPPPCVRLTAPSGPQWAFNEENAESVIEGDAVAFGQVVTQTRNVADTDLVLTGEAATQWMAIAQCFAGPPEDPPAPGARG
ncbi:MAG TPA: TIGR03084 family metal-binding protein [Alphaproteobacteria bacterium]|nr:TIGR03084 family metal-binding protein [Alphaproteobacteria bacterium]